MVKFLQQFSKPVANKERVNRMPNAATRSELAGAVVVKVSPLSGGLVLIIEGWISRVVIRPVVLLLLLVVKIVII